MALDINLCGKILTFNNAISGAELIENFAKQKDIIAVKVNGQIRDLRDKIEEPGAIVEFITTDSPEGLDCLRHSAAHILAQALKEIYGADIKLAIGPSVDNGFYYDIDNHTVISTEDFPAIESKMKEIITRNDRIVRTYLSKAESIEHFKKLDETYKVELIEGFDESPISVYSQGKLSDLCRGPHPLSTQQCGFIRLTKLAGAYWRGDSKNKMLQRIYGVVYPTESQVNDYFKLLAELEKRDHRKLGKDMELFHFQEEAPGAVFWHPRGWAVFSKLVEYMRKRQKLAGYEEINTPEVMDLCMWEKSGHWEKFRENMFVATTSERENTYCIKPMSCPGAVQIFSNSVKSYRDLPKKLSEFGKVHRYEPSGSLHGLMRVRAFTQDDAHIFCTESQILEETTKVCNQMLETYKMFGFDEVRIKFSDRPNQRVGTDEIWDQAEAALLEALQGLGLSYTVNKGDGAFYGPKLEFVFRDILGRDWQVGTVQVDFNLAKRLGAMYVGEDGQKHNPILIHLATFGSLERFLGILLEHSSGHLPLWLASIQIVIVTVNHEIASYAEEVQKKFLAAGLRSIVDASNETMGYKLRNHILKKTPYLVVVGRKEAENGVISVRAAKSDKNEILEINDFIVRMKSMLQTF